MLTTSGLISLSNLIAERSVAIELGRTRPNQISLGEFDTRALANIPSGTIRLSDLYGKSSAVPLLPPIDAYIFDTPAAANAFMTVFVPPTPAEVFSSWGRFAGNNWFPPGTTPTGEATAWQYNVALDRIECTLNTGSPVGFISPTKLDNYSHETTLSSTNPDDDWIGVVAAFANTGSQNIVLYAGRANTAKTWALYLQVGNTTTTLINGSNAATAGFVNGTYQGWVRSGPTRVKVERIGNTIRAQCSTFGQLTYNATTVLTYDMSTNPTLAPLLGPQSYGYLAWSQNASTFTDTVFSGGLAADMVYVVETGDVWKYDVASNTWRLQATTIANSIGFPRYVTNPVTGFVYLIGQTGIVTKQ